MLTREDSRIDDLSIVPDRRGYTFGPPPWWDSYPAIRQQIMELNEAYITTIALFGTDAEAELPEPMLLLSHLADGPQFTDFRGLVADAVRRRTQQSDAAVGVWAAAEQEVLRTLKELDQRRQATLHEVQARHRDFRRDVLDYPREAIFANSADILKWLDGELAQLQSWQQALRAGVEETARVIEDWIDTVRSVDLLSVDEQQQARRDLLAELRRTFPDSTAGIGVQRTIDDGIKAALDAGDVVVMGDSGDNATLGYLVAQMGMLAQENVGAILVQVPREFQPALDGFKSTRDKAQLLSDLQSAGFSGDDASVDALADTLGAAADHDIQVVAFDTRWGQGSGPTQVPIKNHYMAARLTQTLEELEGAKIVAVVADPHTNSDGGLETLTGGVSFDWQPPSAASSPGSVNYDESGDATFVYAPSR